MTMIERIPVAVSLALRQVVLRHPRGLDCQVWRRVVTRPAAGMTGVMEQIMGGLPTLGGMGVLSAEEEPSIEYQPLGAGRLLFCDTAPPMSMMNDRGTGTLAAETVDAQVEALASPGTPEHYTPTKGDLVLLLPGLGAVIAFTVEAVPTPTVIAPMVRRLTLQRRDDLSHLEPFAA
jgi:hypothetical protein